MKYSRNTRFMNNEEQVILVNRISGEWIKIPLVWKNLLDRCMEEKKTAEVFSQYFEDTEDQRSFMNLCSKLTEFHFIIEDDDEECIPISKVQFAITERCNLKCIHCCYDAAFQSKVNTDLQTAEILKILDRIIACEPEYITLSGGEPMIRRDFYQILQYLNDNYKGKITLSTNATLIKDEDIGILTSVISSFDISLDGYNEESCSLVRGRGVFDKVIKNVEKLQKAGAKNIALSMVDINNSDKDVKLFEKLNKRLNTKPIVRVLCPIGRAANMESKLEYLEKIYPPIEVDQINAENLCRGLMCTNCGALRNQFFVNYDGNIYPCGLLIKERYNLGNILNYSNFKETMSRGIEMIPLAKELEALEPDKMPKCQNCNVNFLCWSCLQEADMADGDMRVIEKRCQLRKQVLENIVW